MEIGREGVTGQPNQWPDKIDEEGVKFTSTMMSFHQLLKDLHINVMRAVALGMELDENFFDSFTNVGDNTLRLLRKDP